VLASNAFWTAASGTDFNWASTANWSAGLPSATTEVIFGTPAPNPGSLLAPPNVITLGSGSLASSLWLHDNYTFTGGSLELATGRIGVNAGASAHILL